MKGNRSKDTTKITWIISGYNRVYIYTQRVLNIHDLILSGLQQWNKMALLTKDHIEDLAYRYFIYG